MSNLVPIRKVIDRVNEIREEICVGENDKTNYKSQEQRGKISHDLKNTGHAKYVTCKLFILLRGELSTIRIPSAGQRPK